MLSLRRERYLLGVEYAGWDEPRESLYPFFIHFHAKVGVSNKVSYEYIACQQPRRGVMIISEFAGAAQSLNGSLVVNPWDSQEVADALFEAVTMDDETRSNNHAKLFKVRLILFLLEGCTD
jgi:hypothetical protein